MTATADEPVMLPADFGPATLADLEAQERWLDGEPDAGRGLCRSSTGALVSVPWGARCRWMALHCQAAVCGVWNAAVMADRFVRPRWRYAAVAVGAMAVCVTVIVQPLAIIPVALLAMGPMLLRLAEQIAGPREVSG